MARGPATTNMKTEIQKRFDALIGDHKNQALMISRLDREHLKRLQGISRIKGPCGSHFQELAALRDRLRAARNGLDAIEARMRILLADHFDAPVELSIEVLGRRPSESTYFPGFRSADQKQHATNT